MVESKVASLGPIAQQQFLKNMGIDVRLQVLLRNSNNPITQKQLLDGYDMIMNPERMGERFQFFALLPHSRLLTSVRGKRTERPVPTAPPVAGFSELQF
uniref:Protein arginine methyltransferase NDUFAF7 n=3 Tax=Callorhinchus milii TaxID=7868 RepID=A0A4W3KJ63_CALMI